MILVFKFTLLNVNACMILFESDFGSKHCFNDVVDQDHKKCKKEKDKLWIHYKPSLFQHIGTHSSLKV